jgi:hypothetical protein
MDALIKQVEKKQEGRTIKSQFFFKNQQIRVDDLYMFNIVVGRDYSQNNKITYLQQDCIHGEIGH